MKKPRKVDLPQAMAGKPVDHHLIVGNNSGDLLCVRRIDPGRMLVVSKANGFIPEQDSFSIEIEKVDATVFWYVPVGFNGSFGVANEKT